MATFCSCLPPRGYIARRARLAPSLHFVVPPPRPPLPIMAAVWSGRPPLYLSFFKFRLRHQCSSCVTSADAQRDRPYSLARATR